MTARRPAPGRPVPTSTYRLQVHGGFGFDDASATADYLAALGVSHAYLSPVLQAAPGSTHGYDVVDHSRLSAEAGGEAAFERLGDVLRGHGLGTVVDVVPNHMAVPTPAYLNAQLWSVLRDGPGSPYASWFDVDWSVPDRAILMPVLGARIGQVIDAGELSLVRDGGADGEELVLRYYDHQFPVRPGTEELPLAELVDRQWYRLAHWRVADEELNYRRFFDVDTLAAVRVERPEVFEATHRLLLDLYAAGRLDGWRIDHPDGLADPRGYLDRLADATGDAWVVVEKILEGTEQLPRDWRCAGTTGYDALQRLGGVFVDPAGAAPLSALLTELTGDAEGIEAVVDTAKREVVAQGQYAEVNRLVDLLVAICHDDVHLRDHTRRGLHDSVVELLVAMDRYRAYVVPGEPTPDTSVEVVEQAAARARVRLPEHEHDTLDLVRDLVLGLSATDSDPRRAELVVRFQQTCGPVMAKGIEDTAFYRWFRLASLNEVGGDPEHFGVAPEELHAFFGRLQATWPTSMTTLSTHDTKRAEDVRARLAVLSELPADWASLVREARELTTEHRDPALDPATEYLIWQTVVGTWPPSGDAISGERLHGYLEKAVREAKTHTTWTAPDEKYEAAVHRFADAVLADGGARALLAQWAERTEPAFRVNVLGQKLLQLTAPGVPDVYQGTELVDLSLVDPDNRRPVDYAERRRRLTSLDAGGAPSGLDDEKLLVTSRSLRLRREHPEWFTGPDAVYVPVATTTGNAIAFGRGDDSGVHVVAVATRLPVSLETYGGWREHTLALPEGRWREVFTGREVEGGSVHLADLLATFPVALLTRT
ncbi:malto-oligosyltrehalose synthase [Angustibacter sp. Root456]|uniref:malto-oligosyltrehalose synthase n=1 Tax=Angustibacter sp. Root456 TaxID=1736539 RepID=UPI0006F38709|nr:malto-oligosyltrehalose synthase [Angustibacter sp. Root456]KQX66765.1 maltooligosyl trehalose synthase [Angustibacter sp. Root456]